MSNWVNGQQWVLRFLCVILSNNIVSANNPAEQTAQTLSETRAHFHNPPAAFRPAPLWVWNDDLQEEELALQLDEFKEQGFGGVFVHPRPGLITPYLSERWLQLWRFTAEECTKRGMVSYIYDENSYPSGFAGGIVPERMQDVEQLSLQSQKFAADQLENLVVDSDTVALYRLTPDMENPYARVELSQANPGEIKKSGDLDLPEGEYLLYRIRRSQKSAWYGDRTYVDLMNPKVTDEFLEVTLGAYDTVLKDLYGSSVLACFTDEPQVAGSWSKLIPQAFKERYDYDILDVLPSIHAEIGDWRKVRHDYAYTILDLFMNNFAKPYFEACEQRGIALTGHVWEHGWPNLSHNPDIMSFYAWQHWPGIDCLMNQYSEGVNAQFGNYRSNKEVTSIANQLERPRVLCEAYGAAGWDLNFKDMKRIGDFLLVGGINLINPHLSYYTIRGARKRDHPQSFSYHAPYWEAYHKINDYLGRLSWALAAGEEKNPILVIQPTTTAWMYNWSPSAGETMNRLGSEFQAYITGLGSTLVEFDLGSEPVMAYLGSVKDDKLAVGKREYSLVILPPGLENLESTTVQLLKEFLENGGTVISYVGIPGYVDGRPSEAASELKRVSGDRWIDNPLSNVEIQEKWNPTPIRFQIVSEEKGRVYLLRRQLLDGCLVFLANMSTEENVEIAIEKDKDYLIEVWDSDTGGISQSASINKGRLRLRPASSVLLSVAYEKRSEEVLVRDDLVSSEEELIHKDGEMTITMLDPNVLPLDYVELVLNGEKSENIYFYDAQTRIYKAHGFARNPWDSGVQFADELLRRDHFPPDSGFELHYPFTIQNFDTLPELQLVVERGDRYQVSINGNEVKPESGEWWLDRSFKVYRIQPEHLQQGRNVVSTIAKPFSIHYEPEPVYLLGDFCLTGAESGWTVVPSTPLNLGSWSEQGRPFYSGRVAYKQRFNTKSIQSDSEKNLNPNIRLGHWSGTVARIDVNDEFLGYADDNTPVPVDRHLLNSDPQTASVTVTVYGSLKNVLGPHHAGPIRGSAWPGMFQKAPQNQPPGKNYDVLGYGFSEEIKLMSCSTP